MIENLHSWVDIYKYEKIEEYEERISSLTEQNEVLRKIALENRKNTSKIRSINK